MNFLTIVTPCSRPENLHIIAESINIPKDRYRWIIVFDSPTLPDFSLIPEGLSSLIAINSPYSVCGNAQRNTGDSESRKHTGPASSRTPAWPR